MRRWFVIFMLTLLPLQFSWAAVAAYCGHESTVQSEHLGHHEHQHIGQASVDHDKAPADDRAPSGIDLDCGHCQGTFAGMPDGLDGATPHSRSPRPRLPHDSAVRTLAQSPPERPQWLALA